MCCKQKMIIHNSANLCPQVQSFVKTTIYNPLSKKFRLYTVLEYDAVITTSNKPLRISFSNLLALLSSLRFHWSCSRCAPSFPRCVILCLRNVTQIHKSVLELRDGVYEHQKAWESMKLDSARQTGFEVNFSVLISF